MKQIQYETLLTGLPALCDWSMNAKRGTMESVLQTHKAYLEWQARSMRVIAVSVYMIAVGTLLGFLALYMVIIIAPSVADRVWQGMPILFCFSAAALLLIVSAAATVTSKYGNAVNIDLLKGWSAANVFFKKVCDHSDDAVFNHFNGRNLGNLLEDYAFDLYRRKDIGCGVYVAGSKTGELRRIRAQLERVALLCAFLNVLCDPIEAGGDDETSMKNCFYATLERRVAAKRRIARVVVN